jgi:hypothetical protein
MRRLPGCFDGRDEGRPFGLLGREAGPTGVGQAIILARRTALGFHQIGLDLAVRLHAAHERVDRPFPHIDILGELAGDFVGVAVGLRQQGQHAQRQHAFLQLNFDGFRHGFDFVVSSRC